MEQDIESLAKALLTLEATGEQQNNSDYRIFYKNWGNLGNQEERRQELLDNQKSNRQNEIDHFRGILELVDAVEEDNKLFKPYEKVPYRPNIYVAGFHKTSLTYSNVLMLSEWMVEKPSDFSENWYVVPCPKGVRVLVVANNGTTKLYTKYGHFKFECRTSLPGGNPSSYGRKNCCVLDCFYYEGTNTLYILDLLAWNNQPMTDGETEFRQYWMKIQLEDLADTQTINKKNQLIIKILPMMPCSTQFLSYLLSTYPQFDNNTPPLDGLLFYHKRAHYIAGQTPLVGWLYPFMLPEVLGEEIPMHSGYMEEKPKDYIDQRDFIQRFQVRQARRSRQINEKIQNAMDTTYVEEDGNDDERDFDTSGKNECLNEKKFNTEGMEKID